MKLQWIHKKIAHRLDITKIKKAFFGIINSSKKQTNQLKSTEDIFSHVSFVFLEELRALKFFFEIYWPLVLYEIQIQLYKGVGL